MRELLRDFSTSQNLKEVDTVSAEEHMDDGTPIRLAVTIDRRDGSALLDFEGVLCTLCHAALPDAGVLCVLSMLCMLCGLTEVLCMLCMLCSLIQALCHDVLPGIGGWACFVISPGYGEHGYAACVNLCMDLCVCVRACSSYSCRLCLSLSHNRYTISRIYCGCLVKTHTVSTHPDDHSAQHVSLAASLAGCSGFY